MNGRNISLWTSSEVGILNKNVDFVGWQLEANYLRLDVEKPFFIICIYQIHIKPAMVRLFPMAHWAALSGTSVRGPEMYLDVMG